MKRFLASALIVGVSTFGLVGCEEKSEIKKTEQISTPDGSKKVTETTKIEASGDQKATTPATEPPK